MPDRALRSGLLVALVAVLLAGSLASGATGAGSIGDSPLVDEPSPYEGQTTCTQKPRPGTLALASWLTRTYRATGSMGMMRGCRTGQSDAGRERSCGADELAASLVGVIVHGLAPVEASSLGGRRPRVEAICTGSGSLAR